MKKRHPPGVRRDPGHLHLRQHVHHPEHRDVRHHPRRRVLATATPSTPASRRSSTPAAAWPGSRPATPRRPLTRSPRAPSRPTASSSRAPTRRDAVGSALVICPHGPTEEAAMFDAVDGLEAEHAELESRLGDPEVHADAAAGQAAQPAVRRAQPDPRAPSGSTTSSSADIGAARELAAEDPSFADEADALADAPPGRRGAAAPAARAARPHRRQGRDPRGEVGRGRRGVRAVRGRPAPHVHPLRRDPGAGRSRSSTPPSPTSAATSR